VSDADRLPLPICVEVVLPSLIASDLPPEFWPKRQKYVTKVMLPVQGQ
jgi:hypothetical protein